jgi:hypothetical protein
MLTKTFTVAAVSLEGLVKRGTRATYDVAGTFTGYVQLEKKVGGGWVVIHKGVVDVGISGAVENPADGQRYDTYRFRALDTVPVDTVWTGSAIAQLRPVAPVALNTSGVATDATIEAVESGDDLIHRTVLTLRSTSITLTDEAGQGQAGGVSVYTFPVGNILVLGAVVDAAIVLQGAPWTDTAEGDVGLGTAVTADAQALATDKQNLITTTEIAALVAQAGPIDCQTRTTAQVPLGTAGAAAVQAFLNVRIDDQAAHVTAAGLVTGTISLVWINLGNSA